MKALKIIIILVLVGNGIFSLTSWLGEKNEEEEIKEDLKFLEASYNSQASEGFDLAALTTIVKEVRSGQELERKINKEGSINNLDLNVDGKVDYLSIEEFGDTSNKVGYSIITEPTVGEKQEIATVTIEKNDSTAEIQVIGNKQLYGDGAIYNDYTPIERPATNTVEKSSDRHSYFHHSPLWYSPFHFGFYPPFYSPFGFVGRSMYVSRVSSYSRNVNSGPNNYQQKSNKQISSPNQGKTANKGIKRSLRNPTSTQKNFQTTAKKNLKSGGFGKSPANSALRKQARTARSNSSLGSRRSGRSSSGFGSSRSGRSSSSFGSNRFRSSSSGSRSFGSGGK